MLLFNYLIRSDWASWHHYRWKFFKHLWRFCWAHDWANVLLYVVCSPMEIWKGDTMALFEMSPTGSYFECSVPSWQSSFERLWLCQGLGLSWRKELGGVNEALKVIAWLLIPLVVCLLIFFLSFSQWGDTFNHVFMWVLFQQRPEECQISQNWGNRGL